MSLEDSVPDDATLIKLTHKHGEDCMRALSDAPVLKLKEGKVIRGRKLLPLRVSNLVDWRHRRHRLNT